MKNFILALALTGMIGSVSALSIPQDDKTKSKETVAAKDNNSKSCSKEKSACCKKEGKSCSSNEKASGKACCTASEKKTEQNAK